MGPLGKGNKIGEGQGKGDWTFYNAGSYSLYDLLKNGITHVIPEILLYRGDR